MKNIRNIHHSPDLGLNYLTFIKLSLNYKKCICSKCQISELPKTCNHESLLIARGYTFPFQAANSVQHTYYFMSCLASLWSLVLSGNGSIIINLPQCFRSLSQIPQVYRAHCYSFWQHHAQSNEKCEKCIHFLKTNTFHFFLTVKVTYYASFQ